MAKPIPPEKVELLKTQAAEKATKTERKRVLDAVKAAELPEDKATLKAVKATLKALTEAVKTPAAE